MEILDPWSHGQPQKHPQYVGHCAWLVYRKATMSTVHFLMTYS